MRRVSIAAVLACAAVLAGAACSADGGTGIGALDAPAAQACATIKEVSLARTAQRITVGDLRARLAEAYQLASASSNPLIRTRAVALYADATVLASGGQAPTLDSDLASMAALCSSA
jgi:hypothetical protein